MLNLAALVLMCAPAVHQDTMLKVIAHESGGNPLAIGVNSKQVRLTRQPKSLGEAIATAEMLKGLGIDFDVGYGQLNARNIERLGLSFEQAFHPCENLKATSKILYDNYVRAVPRHTNAEQALTAALSAYNTGHFTYGVKNGYVQKVLNANPDRIRSKPVDLVVSPSVEAPAVPLIGAVPAPTPEKPTNVTPARASAAATTVAADSYSGFGGDSDKYNGWL